MAAPPAAEGCFDRWLRALELQPRVFRALLHAFLLMDLRNQVFGRATATKPHDRVAPMVWVVGQYLLIGLLLAGILFARVDVFFFTFCALGTSLLVIATAIIVEFNEVVLDPAMLEVLGHQPLPPRTFAAARVANLLLYVLLMSVSLNLGPAIAGAGLRDAGLWYVPAYLLVSLASNFALAGLVILLYAVLLKARPNEEIREILAWTQIVLILILFYGGQAIFRDPRQRLEMLAYNLPEWVQWLPFAPLASYVAGCGAGLALELLWIPALTVLSCVLIWLLVLRRLSAGYAALQPGRSVWERTKTAPLPEPGSLTGPFVRRLLRSRAEATGYWLGATMLTRDHELRMRSWPAMGVVIAPLLLGLYLGRLHDPWTHPGNASVLSIACLYLLALPLPTLLHNLNFSRDHLAAWVLQTAPLRDRAGLREGLRKAVTWRFLLPVWLVQTLLFAFTWPSLPHALLHSALGWLIVTGAGAACAAPALRRVPFAAPLARGETMGSIALLGAGVSGVALLLSVAHFYALASSWTFAAYCAAVFVAVFLLRRKSLRV
jgi:hypothetical protein